MSVGEGVGRIQCDCTNITIMQLFYELKQQYPSISDQLVASCLSDHSQHIKPSKCREKLERELNKLPRAYPQQFMGHRMNTDIVQPRKINENFVHSKIPNVENTITNFSTSHIDNSSKKVTKKSLHKTNIESDKHFLQTQQNESLTKQITLKDRNLKEKCPYPTSSHQSPHFEHSKENSPELTQKLETCYIETPPIVQKSLVSNQRSPLEKENSFPTNQNFITDHRHQENLDNHSSSLLQRNTNTSTSSPDRKKSTSGNQKLENLNPNTHDIIDNLLLLRGQKNSKSPDRKISSRTHRKETISTSSALPLTTSPKDLRTSSKRSHKRNSETSHKRHSYSHPQELLDFVGSGSYKIVEDKYHKQTQIDETSLELSRTTAQNFDNHEGFYPITRSKKQINNSSREILRKDRPLSFPQINSEDFYQFSSEEAFVDKPTVRPNFFPVPLLKNSDCEKKPPISPSSVKKFLKNSPTKSRVSDKSDWSPNRQFEEKGSESCVKEQTSNQFYSEINPQEHFGAIKKVSSPTFNCGTSPEKNQCNPFPIGKIGVVHTGSAPNSFVENQDTSELNYFESRRGLESPRSRRRSPDQFGPTKKVTSPNRANFPTLKEYQEQGIIEGHRYEERNCFRGGTQNTSSTSPSRSNLSNFAESWSVTESGTKEVDYYQKFGTANVGTSNKINLPPQVETQEASFKNISNLPKGAQYQNRPTSLDLKPSDINLSVNVNCQVDVLTSPSSRKQTTLQITPELSWCPETVSTPRSFTSVNLTLRTPTSEPLPPIDICSSNSSLTYSTSSFNPKQGLQSRLQITVGPTGIGNVTSVRSRPRSSYTPKEEVSENMIPNKAGSLPDLANGVVQTCSDTKVQLVNQQLERKELLRRELEVGKSQRDAIKREVDALKLQITDEDKNVLLKHIAHLRTQCAMLTKEVDRQSEPRVPLGETNSEFYRNIERCSGRSQRSVSESATPVNGSHNNLNQEPDDSDRWPCHMCTFRNHPLLNKCEQCEMPRILLVSAIPGDNIHIRFSPGNTRRVIHSWVV